MPFRMWDDVTFESGLTKAEGWIFNFFDGKSGNHNQGRTSMVLPSENADGCHSPVAKMVHLVLVYKVFFLNCF